MEGKAFFGGGGAMLRWRCGMRWDLERPGRRMPVGTVRAMIAARLLAVAKEIAWRVLVPFLFTQIG